jgi:hypothetical protein
VTDQPVATLTDEQRYQRVRDQFAMLQGYSYTPRGIKGAGGMHPIIAADLEALLRLAAEALAARAP